MIRRPFRRRSQDATPRPSRADANYLPGTLWSLPWWSDPCCWLSLWRAPAPGSPGSTPPSPLQRRVGATLGLSGPARALRALRPAKLLGCLQAHHGDDVVVARPAQLGIRHAAEEFQKILTTNGLARIRLHDLRHTAATLLLAKGCIRDLSWNCWAIHRSPSR